ncbi:hypothetical protein VTJ04DRAFT_7392 [Mycothermus thermophilus]|uniref:uncharacterized protein n=1 Tax=Humicola insolens TaxID=85995 RepID=UPI00374362D1
MTTSFRISTKASSEVELPLQLFKDQTNSLKIPKEPQPGAESTLNDASGIKVEDGRKRKKKVPNQSTLTRWKKTISPIPASIHSSVKSSTTPVSPHTKTPFPCKARSST